ncbi:MAG: UDP-N-acetylmuramoyl-L-alanine--D-glutamate ligase [Alphaproteobacteria bacterium GM202ARS2]|nr:UDP-N-acetylmuramoyl-L-alanine--D-glutamate ligase [Alphaproteobacteria bacterium GM202ARS2]
MLLRHYESKRVAVLGLGAANRAAAHALQVSGAEVWGWDDDAGARAKAQKNNINLVDLYQANLSECSALLVSPGIPHRGARAHALARRAQADGCPIIGELVLLDHIEGTYKSVAITGTNGKTTTVSLLGHILTHAGIKHRLLGNIGTPIFAEETFQDDTVYVFELSSFQLDFAHKQGFAVAVLLNMASDHVSHHGDEGAYYRAKEQIFVGGSREDDAFVSVDDALCCRVAEALSSGGRHVIKMSTQRAVAGGIGIEDGKLVDLTGESSFVSQDVVGLGVPLMSVVAAYGVARTLGVSSETIMASLSSFVVLAHRLEVVASCGGVTYINDSKATNVHACQYALARYDALFWIAGGSSKGEDLTPLGESMARVRHAFLMGESALSLKEALGGRVDVTVCADMAGAVALAHRQARAFVEEKAGRTATVLLSPACASFDQFGDYKERGRVFTQAVKAVLAQDGV